LATVLLLVSSAGTAVEHDSQSLQDEQPIHLVNFALDLAIQNERDNQTFRINTRDAQRLLMS
jgi:hypothetical protein